MRLCFTVLAEWAIFDSSALKPSEKALSENQTSIKGLIMVEALDIQVKGIVQGVGFRPFVYRLAKKYLLNGWVLNATEGVFIHAEGEANCWTSSSPNCI